MPEATSTSPAASPPQAGANPPCWRGAVLYQIYPRSFCDSNGDGVGDLPGITQRLPYVASLGVDGIWISPFFPSPQRDFGYDVQDYCSVAPQFGSLADFDALLAQAHALGLKVVIDQVWSHTALEHPWFDESRQSRDNPRADWYVWADAKPDGSPPTNWQSWMGGGTWTWEPRRQQYYLHNFLPQMPDLNLHHAEVQDAILAVGRFWLERGVDGFRLDTANYYCHDPLLRDNPPQPPERRGDVPAAMQQHLFNICQPQTLLFLERIRALMDEFGRNPAQQRFSVAEIGSANNLERMVEYTAGSQRLHTAYSFLLLGSQPTPTALAEMLNTWQHGAGAQAWPSWALSNHDTPRVASRWAEGEPLRTGQCLALLMMLRGTLFLYQGEELGLGQAEISPADMRDPFGIAHYPRIPSRDGCRTPMPWQADAPHAGFSQTSGTTWLPLWAPHRDLAVDQQEANPASLLHLTRRLIALRRAHPALRWGDVEVLQADEQVLALRRRHGSDSLLAVFNLSPSPARCSLSLRGPAALSWPGSSQNEDGNLLPPWAVWIGSDSNAYTPS
ncbi:MAG: alpha-amylase family glycosyl hydrolase [Ideonella sp.]|nr:alpha-amylase family glycosyl hydrolase [Ideonella sp.]